MVLELPVEERKCNRCHFASTDLTQCFYSVFREANNYVVRYTPCAKMTRASNPAADAEPEYVYSADLLHKMEPCSRFEASIRAARSARLVPSTGTASAWSPLTVTRMSSLGTATTSS